MATETIKLFGECAYLLQPDDASMKPINKWFSEFTVEQLLWPLCLKARGKLSCNVCTSKHSSKNKTLVLLFGYFEAVCLKTLRKT